jgi:hypothetical protein
MEARRNVLLLEDLLALPGVSKAKAAPEPQAFGTGNEFETSFSGQAVPHPLQTHDCTPGKRALPMRSSDIYGKCSGKDKKRWGRRGEERKNGVKRGADQGNSFT